jgi:hypothetical protein
MLGIDGYVVRVEADSAAGTPSLRSSAYRIALSARRGISARGDRQFRLPLSGGARARQSRAGRHSSQY